MPSQRRIGKFEAAHESTLLLDEIAEMRTALQAKLLRVLQEKEVERGFGQADPRRFSLDCHHNGSDQ